MRSQYVLSLFFPKFWCLYVFDRRHDNRHMYAYIICLVPNCGSDWKAYLICVYKVILPVAGADSCINYFDGAVDSPAAQLNNYYIYT